MENRFDNAAVSWDENPGRLQFAQKFADEVRRNIAGCDFRSALEYGCGTGNVSFCLQEYFDIISLADTSQGMLDQLQRKIEASGIAHFTPLMLDLEKQSSDEKYDVIYTLMTMHHIGDIQKVVNEFGRMMVPGGLLIIGDLVTEDGDFHAYPDNQGVHYGFEQEFLSAVLQKSGFRLNEFKVFHRMERTHTGTAKEYSLFPASASKLP